MVKLFVKQTLQGVVELDPQNYPEGTTVGEMVQIERESMETNPDYFECLDDANEQIQMSVDEGFFKDKIDWREFAMQHNLSPAEFTNEIFAAAATLGRMNMEAKGTDFWGMKFGNEGEPILRVFVDRVIEDGDTQEETSESSES